jgi:HD-GYP domain-containing protein (c-di-GMP phosphodiesterase class II)
MTTTAESGHYLAYHSVNTCLLSIVVGAELGLAREQVYDLGKSALFHDIGAATADPAVLAKREKLTPADKAHIAQSPLVAAKLMLRTRPLDLGTLKCILAAHEAKQSFFKQEVVNGQTKYVLADVGVFGRIIRLASTYDALTSARPFRPAMTPEDALQLMSTKIKFDLDPFLLSMFTKILAGRSTKQMHGATISPL